MAKRREEPVGVPARGGGGEKERAELQARRFLPVPRPPRAPAHLWSRDMTGTPGTAATRDGEAPERSPPCGPSHDLTGKVGGLRAQRWGLWCQLWGPPLPPPPSPSLAASALDSSHPPQAARCSQSKWGRVETAPGAHTNGQGSGRGERSVGSTE